MSSFSCPHQVNEICLRVDGAYCRPGMRGCVLCGKVVFEDGVIPAPRWPVPRGTSRRSGPPRGEGAK
ncbi:MAG TPA: hypothetical protein VLV17_06450 [Anaeromyxobacteraceae bacterium]|nr:hypothetical protein [Anaeromyxobacteraceae bacterium]